MITVRFSPFSKDFSSRLPRLEKDFEKQRSAVLLHGFTHLPWEEVASLARLRLPPSCDGLCVVGMGGASLGARALIEGLHVKNVTFLDNIDPDFVAEKLRLINLKKTLFVIISKSGATIEVLSLAQILLSRGISKKNFIVITDDKKSALGKIATDAGLLTLPSSVSIPGRFSVLSIVGLLPATLSGVRIQKVLDGAMQTVWKDAYRLACVQYLHFMEKRRTAVLFSYAEALNSFTEWYIQLVAESIGKSARVGITPTKAIGTKDQHSQLQLFLDGPDERFYIFLKSEKTNKEFSIPGRRYSLGELFNAEYQGVIEAYRERRKPFVELHLPQITQETIGELFFFFELSTAFLGTLLKIPIDTQPAVELSKKKTLRLLR